MSGKVELTIERYEELRGKEDSIKEIIEMKDDEIKKLKKEMIDPDKVLVHFVYIGNEERVFNIYGSGSIYQYKGRDAVLSEISEKNTELYNDIKKLKDKVDNSTFISRFKYLVTGKL